MKKLILTTAILLTGLFTVNAQDAAADKQATKTVNEYTSVAQLTPDQAAKIKPIIETSIETRKANKQKYANSPDSLKIANKANRENMKTQLKAVLSADQIKKIEDYNKAKKERNSGGTSEE